LLANKAYAGNSGDARDKLLASEDFSIGVARIVRKTYDKRMRNLGL